MAASGGAPVRVLYVGGTGRSGSTMLANVLGEVPGLVSVGEVRFLWERGVLENRLCGCGERFSDCPFWSEVMRRALGDISTDEVRQLAESLHREIHDHARLRRLPSTVTSASARLPEGSMLGGVLPKLYAAIAETAAADVVVDSSKLPTYARLLADTDGVEVSVAHLVRDPRAAAFSWRRTKAQPDRGTAASVMEQRGAAKSAALWVTWNYGLEKLWRKERSRYERLSYERFLARPEESVRTLLDRLGLPSDLDGVFTDASTVRLGANHTVAGNPARLEHGLVPMRLDDEWRTAMGARERRLVAALSYPLMRHYGYHRER